MLAEVKDSITLNLPAAKVSAKLTAGVKITDVEAKDYYDKHIQNYQKPTSRDLAHILVKTKAKAENSPELQNGADFAKLAKKIDRLGLGRPGWQARRQTSAGS